MRNLLITGIRGFIGTHLANTIQNRGGGYNIVGFDKDGYIGKKCPQWDCIVHLAGLARLGDCEKDMVQCMQSNIVLTAEILQQCSEAFIYAGTCSPPTTIYGKSKAWAEELVTYEAKKRGMALRIFRFTNVYGEGQNPEKLLPKALEAARKGIPFIPNDNALPLEYVSVERVVDEIMVAMADAHYLPGSIRMPRKLCDGTIKDRKQLMEWAKNVVHTDAQPA